MEAKEITIKLIEKNGFKEFFTGLYVLPMEDKDVYLSIFSIKTLPNANGAWLVTIKNGYTNAEIAITYVHELQQALTLCGVDKKIEV